MGKIFLVLVLKHFFIGGQLLHMVQGMTLNIWAKNQKQMDGLADGHLQALSGGDFQQACGKMHT